MNLAYLRLVPLALLLACGPDDKNDTTADGGSTGGDASTGADASTGGASTGAVTTGGEMTCAELPAGKIVLDASLDATEPPLTIAVISWIDKSCGLQAWTGTLKLPEDVTPGTYDLSDQPPSLFVEDEAVGTCEEQQSAGVAEFMVGTVEVLSSTDDCLVVELNADRAVMGGMAATYRGVFALDR